ncbi:MAG: putative integral rane protein, partial [Nocardioidaceae bacterium]|nr:putative integral rane protein [Nocardioidaceae bacterium]
TIWIASSLLACAFVVVGAGKLLASPADLQQLAHGVPVALLKIAGAAEMLGAIGLVVPAATRIVPVLTPIAATGLVATMVGATITNIIIGEPASAVLPVVLGTGAALVALARFGPCAVEPRSDRSDRDRLVPTAAR